MPFFAFDRPRNVCCLEHVNYWGVFFLFLSIALLVSRKFDLIFLPISVFGLYVSVPRSLVPWSIHFVPGLSLSVFAGNVQARFSVSNRRTAGHWLGPFRICRITFLCLAFAVHALLGPVPSVHSSIIRVASVFCWPR